MSAGRRGLGACKCWIDSELFGRLEGLRKFALLRRATYRARPQSAGIRHQLQGWTNDGQTDKRRQVGPSEMEVLETPSEGGNSVFLLHAIARIVRNAPQIARRMQLGRYDF